MTRRRCCCWSPAHYDGAPATASGCASQTSSGRWASSPARLRTWERRYGIPHPDRSATGRRLYDEDDLAVIRRMAALVDAGVPAAQAAEATFSELESGTAIEFPAPPAPEVDPLVFAIADAAQRYDEPALQDSLHQAAPAGDGWRGALGEVVFPAMREVGERWQRGELPLSAEHFASAIIRRELLAAVSVVPEAPPDAPAVVLACPEDERHDLGITALWLLVRQADLRVIFLGADVPAAELLSALSSTDADAIALTATATTSLPTMGLAARALVAARVRARIFVGGPAIDDSEVAREIPGVRLPHAIDSAADTLIEALTNPGPHA